MISNVLWGSQSLTMSSEEENVATTTIGAPSPVSPVSVGPQLQPVTGLAQHRSLPLCMNFTSLGENQTPAEKKTTQKKLVRWRRFVNQNQ